MTIEYLTILTLEKESLAEKYKSFDTGNADKVYDDKEEGQANNEDQRGEGGGGGRKEGEDGQGGGKDGVGGAWLGCGNDLDR